MITELNSKEGKQGVNTEEEIEIYRLSVSKMAGQALLEIVERVNDGFQGGKVNRSQIANWCLLHLKDNLTADDIKVIRADHLDEFAALDAVLRRAKETGKLPPELSAYIQKQIGCEEAPKKKAKKSLQGNNINDVISENEKL